MKLSFERAALLVFILILLVSNMDLYKGFLDLYKRWFDKDKEAVVSVMEDKPDTGTESGFIYALVKADNLYNMQRYKEAAQAYLALVLSNTLTMEQKKIASFKLGMCNYYLKQYEKAKENFLSVVDLNADDALAYNNAAVCAFLAKDEKSAMKYQEIALAKLPIAEFHYNMARVFESQDMYSDAAKNYLAVIKGEENITRDDLIDSVRIKDKINKLVPEKQDLAKLFESSSIAIKNMDDRDMLLLEDTDMTVKNYGFEWHVVPSSSMDKLYCKYDKEKNDPYHLIKNLKWIVTSGGEIVYTSNEESTVFKLNPVKKYTIALAFNGVQKSRINIENRKSADMPSNNNTGSNTSNTSNETPSTINQLCKWYDYAVYEQVFEKGFKLGGKGYTDRFGVIWGKDNIESEIMDKDFIDAGNALDLKNNTEGDAGIWANLDTLLSDKNLRGQPITIKFYARKISDNPQLRMRFRTKSGKRYKTNMLSFSLDYRWQQVAADFYIPNSADGLTLSLDIASNEEIKLDGFIIVINK